LKAIAGLLAPASEVIDFLGNQTNRLPVFELVKLGLGLVPEGRGVFNPHHGRNYF
jgi:branched-chain amino acid transport system ATP-binding protein